MKKLLLLFLVTISVSLAVNAQDNGYKNALGVRLGSSVPAIKSGITYKHFLNQNAIEGILSFGDGVGICGLYEIHKPLSAAENLQLDYKFAQIPLNLTLDWKPELNIVSKVGFESSGIGFSARFTF
jgi:hypothetical protein